MSSVKRGPISKFILHHYRHFNAAAVVDSVKAYEKHLEDGNKMLVTLAGAMSTAELGLSLAEMIRQGKVHGICCTGANLEEDIFNLVAHEDYERVPNWRNLKCEDDQALYDRGMNRVTDTCIPEDTAMRRIEKAITEEWKIADKANKTMAPHEYFWSMLKKGTLKEFYQIDIKDSWVNAAMEKNIPIFTPGWEDSTCGNKFAAANMAERVNNVHIVESGIQTMQRLAAWYVKETTNSSIGFFQIGGGIAGDFPICVVPMIHQDLGREAPLWSYFCQISDSTTSYGSYSGATPSEKITWGKLGVETPKFIIESDATIVAPLMFAYLLNQ